MAKKVAKKKVVKKAAKKKVAPKKKVVAKKKVAPKKKVVAKKKVAPKKKVVAKKKVASKKKIVAKKKVTVKKEVKKVETKKVEIKKPEPKKVVTKPSKPTSAKKEMTSTITPVVPAGSHPPKLEENNFINLKMTKAKHEDPRTKHDDHEPTPEVEHPPLKPIVREEEKVGRNDPCPCGSGKKFKKCCGLNAN